MNGAPTYSQPNGKGKGTANLIDITNGQSGGDHEEQGTLERSLLLPGGQQQQQREDGSSATSTSIGGLGIAGSSLATSANDISRPSSAASMRIRVDKQSAESISGSGLFTHQPNGYDCWY
jgi:hypothetical protein